MALADHSELIRGGTIIALFILFLTVLHTVAFFCTSSTYTFTSYRSYDWVVSDKVLFEDVPYISVELLPRP